MEVSAAAYGTLNALTLTGVTKRFGAVTALDQASLSVRPGTVHAVLGENGAGKTTLMRVAFGLLKPNSGTVEVRGRTVQFSSPSDALAAGVGMVHQHFTLVPAMTVAENVAMGGRGLFSRDEWAARVRSIGERTGLVLDPLARVADLSVSAQQRCEIVKALSRDVQLLILDEPTAVLAPEEAQELLRWMQRFAADGRAIVLITHKLRDAMAIAADITVLRHGRTVMSGPAAETNEEELAAAMLGTASATVGASASASGSGNARGSVAPSADATASASDKMFVPKNARASSIDGHDYALREVPVTTAHASTPSPTSHATNAQRTTSPTLALNGAGVRDTLGITRLANVTLNVHPGEIVGVAAIEGAGQRELLRVLAGRLPVTAGSVTLPMQIGFVPEDRHNDALLLDSPIVDNVALRDAGSRTGNMPWKEIREATTTIIARNDVKAQNAQAPARTLSGGNQQKLILGREMADRPRALVVENPTRGLDFRSAGAVHAALRAARDDGTALVVYSSDLDEVLLLADRIVVMHAGRLIEVPNERTAIGRAMLGT